LTGHGDLNSKLVSFGLVSSASCRCMEEGETIEHVLFRYSLLVVERKRLRSVVCKEREKWSCQVGRFVETRALATFPKEAIGRKKEYTYRNGLRRLGIG